MVDVLVAASAAALAQECADAADRLRLAADGVTRTSAVLAGNRKWAGSSASAFDVERRSTAAALDRLVRTVQRMAHAARSVIGEIDADDATGRTVLTTDGFPPVHGWTDPEPVVVNDMGAFQPDHGNDYRAEAVVAQTMPLVVEGELAYADAIMAGSQVYPGPDAARFFAHYLDGTGSDLPFDTTVPYGASPHFATLVNTDVRAGIAHASATGQDSFDSGYVYHSDPFPDNPNWTGAIKGSFRRVTGHRRPDGTWAVALGITSYYQFVPGQDFGPGRAAKGSILHNLEELGVARDYHSIGTGTLLFDREGNPIPVTA